MRRIAAASLALGLWLTLGVAAPRTAPASVSFATTKGIVTGPGAASVLLDTGKGTFTRIKRQPNGMPRIATADASGDLNGDGKPDLVTHLNTSEDGEGITIDGVTIYPAYAFVNLRKRNGTFRGRHRVYEDDYVDIAGVATGDVNGDRRPDVELVTVDSDGDGAVTVLLNLGKGRFKPAKRPLRTPPEPAALAAVDVNGDGRLDLVTASHGGKVAVFQNLGGGSFATRRDVRLGAGPTALAVGDLNGDRRPDLAIARASSGVHVVTVLLNLGHGAFGRKRDYATPSRPVSVAIGDVNGDRRPDLATANNDAANASVLLNEGGGRFGSHLDYPTGSFPGAVAIGNFDGRGRRDLLVPALNGVAVLTSAPGVCDVQDVWGQTLAAATRSLALTGCLVGTVSHAPSTGFANGHVFSQSPLEGAIVHGGAVNLTVSDGPGPAKLHPNPTFAAPKSYATPKGAQVVETADLNGDGAPDVVSGNCGNTVSVLLNNGHGALAARHDYRVASCPDGVTLSDLNGDHRPDIVTANDEGSLSVLLNNGDGTFGPRHDYPVENGPTYGSAFAVVADLTGDAKPDLAALNGLTIYPGNGDGTFAPAQNSTLGGDAEALAVGDFNADGKPDLVTEDDSFAGLLLNQGGGNLADGGRYLAGDDGSNVFAGDLTGDGVSDVVVTDPDASMVQVLLDEAGTLRRYVEYSAGPAPGANRVAIGDVNGDGAPDLAVAGRTLSILRNRGNGSFLPRRLYSAGKRPPRAVAIGDLNGDGKADLVTANGQLVAVLLQH